MVKNNDLPGTFQETCSNLCLQGQMNTWSNSAPLYTAYLTLKAARASPCFYVGSFRSYLSRSDDSFITSPTKDARPRIKHNQKLFSGFLHPACFAQFSHLWCLWFWLLATVEMTAMCCNGAFLADTRSRWPPHLFTWNRCAELSTATTVSRTRFGEEVVVKNTNYITVCLHIALCNKNNAAYIEYQSIRRYWQTVLC